MKISPCNFRSSAFAATVMLSILLVPTFTTAQTPATFDIGAAVEVREGNVWSKAQIEKKEGRRFLIKYIGDDGAEEWVTADRLRQPGTVNDATSTQPAAGQSKSSPTTRATQKAFARGDLVEVRDGARWRPASVVNFHGDWLLIEYQDFRNWREWVEPWRIRATGSTTDNLPFIVRSNPRWKSGDAPPTAVPGPAPAKDDSGFDSGPAPAIIPGQPVVEADRSGNQELLIADPGGVWSVTPDAAPDHLLHAASMRALMLDNELNRKKVEVRRTAGLAVYSDFFAEKKILAECLDLATGQSIEASMPLSSMPMALSPSGKMIAARSNEVHNSPRSRVDLFSVAGNGDVAHLVSFNPYADSGKPRDVEWLEMIDDSNVLTCDTDGQLTAWQVSADSAKAKWTLTIGKDVVHWHSSENEGGVALSVNGKYIYTVSDDGAAVIDALSGKTVGLITGDATSAASHGVSSLTVSPSGRTLLAVTGGSLAIWDLATGKFVRTLATAIPVAKAFLVSDDAALLPSGQLIDLKTGAIAWQYMWEGGGNAIVGVANRQVCYLISNRLCVTTLPQPSAAKALSAITDDSVMLKPGMKVAFELTIESTPEQKAKIEAALTHQIESAGLSLDAASPVKVIATTENGKTTQRTYRRIGPRSGPGVESVSVTEKITKLSIVVDGKEVWSRSSNNTAGMFVGVQNGQSTQDAVNGSNQFNFAFFESFDFPSVIPKLQDPLSIPKSELLAAGPKDKK